MLSLKNALIAKKGFQEQKKLIIKILREMFFQSVTQGAQKEKIWVLPTGVVSRQVQMLYFKHY